MEIKGYAIRADLTTSYDIALQKTKDALAKEGFGVIMTIDMHEKLKEKLGVTIERYMILGACSPKQAYAALQAEPEIGLLLPCNVIVYEKPGGVGVAAINPALMLGIANNPALSPLAAEIDARLRRAIEALERG